MDAEHASDLLQETLRRTRAVIAVSHASIERADDRVRDSLRLLMRWRSRFDFAIPILSDVQLADSLERWQAMAEQHQVELEMQRTQALVKGGAMPVRSALPDES